jgi:hypothetical protein
MPRVFESTLPMGSPELMRASAFRRYLAETEAEGEALNSALSTLSPSLMQDLMRFERDGHQGELLEVVAAAIRHARALAVNVQYEDRVLPFSLFPIERLVHCPMPMSQVLDMRLSELAVLSVEPAVLRPPGDRERSLVAEAELYSPLGPLTWELALRGSREELLPEISPNAAYRITPGTDLRGLPISGTLSAAVHRLKRQTTNLKELSDWPGFDRGRAMRLLNGLYLQAALMITRTHPAATNEGWFSSGRG